MEGDLIAAIQEASVGMFMGERLSYKSTEFEELQIKGVGLLLYFWSPTYAQFF